jgi:hypothetical protein
VGADVGIALELAQIADPFTGQQSTYSGGDIVGCAIGATLLFVVLRRQHPREDSAA